MSYEMPRTLKTLMQRPMQFINQNIHTHVYVYIYIYIYMSVAILAQAILA